jgi:menaquinone-dependent protoporphyrinogen oxidase
MMKVPVFYATTEGQTGRIAEQIASTLRQQGLDNELLDLSREGAARIDWANVRGVVVGGSIHGGRHQRALTEFVERQALHLGARPSAFFSVSLSAGSRNAVEVEAARALVISFVRSVGWEPRHVACFAGKLAYTQYGLIKRVVMQFIAWREGAPTDARRDYEFTDWKAVRQFALDVSQDVCRGARDWEVPAVAV